MMMVASIEARMTSSRLPGKMALPLGGSTVLGVLIDRLKLVPELDDIVLATTSDPTDDVLQSIAEDRGIRVFRGSVNDVLGRVRGALDLVGADVCVEITGDCPLTDPRMVSRMLVEFLSTRSTNRYVANTTGPTLGAPHGLDVQVFDADALRKIDDTNFDAESREHVSLPFYRAESGGKWHPRFVEFFPNPLCHQVWISLDYRQDYELIGSVYDELSSDPSFGAQAIVDACLRRGDATRACLQLRSW